MRHGQPATRPPACPRPSGPATTPATARRPRRPPKLPIVNDYESWAEAKAEAWASDKEDLHATLKAVGFPPDLGFECWKKKQHEEAGTFVKEKDLPDWCFLQTEPKRQLCISMDGKNVNTLFLVRKRRVLETETAFGKPLKMTILDSTKEKVGSPQGDANDEVQRTSPRD